MQTQNGKAELTRLSDRIPEKDLKLVRFDSDIGKHGDTGTSEQDVLRAAYCVVGSMRAVYHDCARTPNVSEGGSLYCPDKGTGIHSASNWFEAAKSPRL